MCKCGHKVDDHDEFGCFWLECPCNQKSPEAYDPFVEAVREVHKERDARLRRINGLIGKKGE